MQRPTPDAILRARDNIRALAVRTPLIRWPDESCELWLKLECLQPIGSFKIRGAANALANADPSLLRKGVFTASAGNMAQGVAWCARLRNIPCTVIVPDHAPLVKLAAIKHLNASIIKVPFDRWWRVLQDRQYEGLNGHFIHPVSDPDVIAGNATVAMELAEDLTDIDRVYVPFGGGGLSCGLAAGLSLVSPSTGVTTVEPETAAPFAASLHADQPTAFDYTASFIDGAGGKTVLAEMWPLARDVLAGATTVSLAEVAEAVRRLMLQVRVVAEGAGALAVAAALRETKSSASPPRIVAIVSGGNIDPERLATILSGGIPQ
jgi:threonine dehydratase